MPHQPDVRWSFDTRTVHHPSPVVPLRPAVTPIYQTSTFRDGG